MGKSLTFAVLVTLSLSACWDWAKKAPTEQSGDNTPPKNNNYVVSISEAPDLLIDPKTSQVVASGLTSTFKVTTPLTDFLVEVGGNCPAGSWTGDFYSTGPISGDCSISFSLTYRKHLVTPVVDAHLTVSPSTPQEVNQRSVQAFVLTPESGYEVSPAVGGNCERGYWPSSNTYNTGNIFQTCTVSFSSRRITYTITPSVDSHLAVVPSVPQAVESGSSQSFTLTPASGFLISPVITGTCRFGTWSGNTYTTGVATAHCFVAFSSFPLFHTVTPVGDVNLTLNPSTKKSVQHGFTKTFSLTPKANYSLSSTVGGTCPPGSWDGSEYTTGTIVEDCDVRFSAQTTVYSVVFTGDGNLTLGSSSPQSVPSGSKFSLTVMPSAGYEVTVVGGTCAMGSWSANTYTTGIIKGNCTLSFSSDLISYDVTASGDTYVSVSPSTVQTVAPGLTRTYTVETTKNQKCSTVAGTCTAGTWSGNEYTTGLISSDCSVIFSACPLTLHDFGSGPTDGRLPQGKLTRLGNVLFGTTMVGGSESRGTVFRINTDGSNYTILHHFTKPTGSYVGEGSAPNGGLLLVGEFLYGMTRSGGYPDDFGGTIFRIKTDGSSFKTLHSFGKTEDWTQGSGTSPRGGLILIDNTLYGMTWNGQIPGFTSGGAVFSISLEGTDFSTLYRFYGFELGVLKGTNPFGSLLVIDNLLFGTTSLTNNSFGSGGGTVFRLGVDGNSYADLHFFNRWVGEENPRGSLIFQGDSLIGTTTTGGSAHKGSLFSLKMDGTGLTVLHEFSGPDGQSPTDSLLPTGGRLYGLTEYGGLQSKGTLFSLRPDGTDFVLHHSFLGEEGSWLTGSLIHSGDVFFGAAAVGGQNGQGTIFGFVP